MQEPSEEAFDIDSVLREVKSQPLTEKKAFGKKPIGVGALPRDPSSTIDSYKMLLLSIPNFASFGKLFKVGLLNYCHNLYYEFFYFFIFAYIL